MTVIEINTVYLCEKSEWPICLLFDYYNQYIQWYIRRWGGQRLNICQSRDRSEQWPAHRRRILLWISLHIHLLLQWALWWSEALGQYKVDGAAGREGRVWGESSSGVTHSTHTVHTECTDCTPGQVLSQDIVCKLLTVQSVQDFRFFSGIKSTKPLTQNDATSYKRSKVEK